MAKMIPSSGPREHDPRSREGEIYQALKMLSDDYYVIHSMSLVDVTAGGALKENEGDFIIFNKKKGILCVEAKAGQISYSMGEWLYSDGRPMRNGGPYNQSQQVKYRIIDKMKDVGLNEELKHCKILHAVWFPSITRAKFCRLYLPPEADENITLLNEDLRDPSKMIEAIFNTDTRGFDTKLDESEAQRVLDRVLCPYFSLVPTRGVARQFDKMAMAQLLKSQQRILDFMEEQRFAVFNGVAGSGKTLIAVEYAERKANAGERVLLLCYNKLLKENLRNRCQDNPLIDVYSLDGFACKICRTNEADYELLQDKLLDESYIFPYLHVVIDEGQDFGIETAAETDVLEALKLLVERDTRGTMYLFYDRNQLIQGTGIPAFINDADCKMSLYVNCRNTWNIAKCSVRSLDVKNECRVRDGSVDGSMPKMYFSRVISDQAEYISRLIADLHKDELTDIVILTCETEATSLLKENFRGKDGQLYWQRTSVPVVSCRRYKGLEADAVILIDVSPELWLSNDDRGKGVPPSGLMFYTGASRARHELYVICDMDEDDCIIGIKRLGGSGRSKPYKTFARLLNALVI